MNNYNEYYNWVQPWNRSVFRNMNSNNQSLMNPKEGFDKGNMFTNLYSEYKNYQPETLKAINEQERKMLELQATCFAAHDLNLYLDIHPEDQSMIALFHDYRRKVEELTSEYERKFGPLTVGSNESNPNSFEWVESPWPWEGYNV